MDIYSTYSVKIKHYNRIFLQSVEQYRKAVDFFINVCMKEWEVLGTVSGVRSVNAIESLTVRTKKRPEVRYDFSKAFYKFPSYLRRSAIAEAYGKVSSYMSLLSNYKSGNATGKPGFPKAGRIYPALYRDNCYVRLDDHTAQIKVYLRNTWDWLKVSLNKGDVDYILRHCSNRKECSPTLQKRGKEWFLDFPFQEKIMLKKKDVKDQTILAVDLGMNSACVCAAMKADGTVIGREFLHLPVEKDHLTKSLNRIKKAQQHGNRRTPRLWARAKGYNDDIAVKTAAFIMEQAGKYQTEVIVFEHLKLNGKKSGSKKQKLHLWKAQYVQSMVTGKAHRSGIHISRINAWGTSRLAYDGSGFTRRGKEAELNSYSLCRFQNGKVYNCDLNAAYNIGARYYIREITKSLPETERLEAEAKVPQCSKRSTCTLSTLISLNAVMTA